MIVYAPLFLINWHINKCEDNECHQVHTTKYNIQSKYFLKQYEAFIKIKNCFFEKKYTFIESK